MANKIKEIKSFFAGIVSSFSSSDIKDDAASFSLNVDSSDKDGVLKGSKAEDSIVSSIEVNSDVSKVLESEDDVFDVVYADAESGEVKVINDLYGAKKIQSPINASSLSGTASSMEVKSDKVYVGHGKSLPSKILYKTKNIPFAKDSEDLSEWYYENSSIYDKRLLNSSFSIDRFINFPGASDDAYTSAIGIKYDHKDIYYVDYHGQWSNSNKSFDFSSNSATIHLGASDTGKNTLIGAACDICQADVKAYANGVEESNGALVANADFNVWILSLSHTQSEATDAVPMIQKFKISANPGTSRGGTHSVKGEHSLIKTYLFEFENGETPPSGAIPGSVLETENFIWVQYWKPSGDNFARKENFLYCCRITDIVGGTIILKNKSLNYDKIRKARATINFGNKNITSTDRETYFYNQDMPWETLKSGNWLRGDEDWNNSHVKGNYYYSGIYAFEGDPGFKPARHGLIQSPMTDKENPNFQADSGEDWVAVLTTCDKQMINIKSAKAYRVPGGWNWHSYYKLRASDDNGAGSDNEGGNGFFSEFFSRIFNVIDYLFSFEFGGQTSQMLRMLGVCPDGIEFNGKVYGDVDLNWYYNGKCFETGVLKTQLINISSNHIPSAKFNSQAGARIHIKELYGFNKNLEVICIKHYNDRLMISCHDPSTDDKHINTAFFMYNTSDNSVTETNPINIMVLNPDDPNIDSSFADTLSIPDEYLQQGSTSDEPGDHPNRIFQMYIPVTDVNIHNYGAYPELAVDVDTQLDNIWPHAHSSFFALSGELAILTSHLVNNNASGDIFYTEDATFDVYRTGRHVFDGRTTRMDGGNSTNNGIGYSHQATDSVVWKTEGDHISFMSTAGPFNVSKFNFLIVKNSNGSVLHSYQTNIPTNAHLLFPDDGISLLSLNQTPNNDEDKDVKQYSLDSKSLSFSVKSHRFDGSNIAPFIYNEDEGKELYRYKINLVYDGYQDSPLSKHYTQVNITDINVRHNNKGTWSASVAYKEYDYVLRSGEYYTCLVDHTSTDSDNKDTGRPETSDSNAWNQEDANRASALAVTINLHKPEIFSRRITHVRLWRSRNAVNEGNVVGDDVYTIEQSYTLVDTVPLGVNWFVSNEAVQLYNGSSTDNSLGEVAVSTVIDNGVEGPSFEAYTGMPESVTIYQPNYTMSTQLHSYLYVANCSHPSFEDASNLIFRSKPDKFNMFDWSRDFISIPSTPKAITSFNGRIIVWDFNNMYIINPSGLYIEDTYEGTGCLSSSSFERTENGICFADENNIYLFDGKEVKNIGIPIITSHKQGLKISWRDRDKSYPTHIKFESDIRCFCVFFKINSDVPYNWLLRAIKASHYLAYSDLDLVPQKWYEIPGAEIDFSTNQNSYTYIWHLGMWKEQFENMPIDSYEDYTFNLNGQNIVLPYGTGYNTETKNYIVDLELFFSGVNINGILDSYDAEFILNNNLFILQKNDYPNYANIITDGKLDMEHTPSYYFFTYNIDKSRWDLHLTSKYRGVFNGAKGELYSSMITRNNIVLDLNLLSSDLNERYYTYGSNPLGGKGNIANELDFYFGSIDITSDDIISMRKGPTIDGYEFYNGPIQGMQWYRNEVGVDGNTTLYEYYIDMEITREQGDEYWSEESKEKWEFLLLGQSEVDINLIKYDSNVGQSMENVKIISGNIDEVKIYLGHTMNYPNGNEDAVAYAERLVNDYTGNQSTWVTTIYTNTDYPISEDDNVNEHDFIEVTSANSHNLSVGDKVKITEIDWIAVTTGGHRHGNTLGSPFKHGLIREIYSVDGNKFRFKVLDDEEYFNTEEWNFDTGYLDRWRNELWYEPWPHSEHHGTAKWELQEDWMEELSIGDLNRDGGINIQDISIAQEATYIVIKGSEFKEKSYTVRQTNSEGEEVDYIYYPDVLIIDPTSPTNYHRLPVIWCYSVTNDSNQEVSYLLLKNESYEPFSDNDLGWNTSEYNDTTNQFPEDTEVIIDDENVILPGEPGLKELFSSPNSQQFTFISKNFSFKNQTTNKILSKIKIIFNNTPPSFEYMINNNNQWIVPNTSEIKYTENSLEYKIPLIHKKVKSLKVKITSNSNESNSKNYDTEVDSFSIIYRERGNA